jgi:hypothetical protein
MRSPDAEYPSCAPADLPPQKGRFAYPAEPYADDGGRDQATCRAARGGIPHPAELNLFERATSSDVKK